MSRPAPPPIDAYRWFCPITTRWSDNDLYGHVNNVVYYSYFDSIANRYLIEVGGLDIHGGEVIGLVVNSSCDYHAPLAYPQALTGALRVDRLGNSSVTYGIALFPAENGSADGEAGSSRAAANGSFTHVFVHRRSQRPVPIPEPLRRALSALT